MSGMFYKCSSLKYLPDIFINNNNNKFINMSYMLYKCSSLLSLPNISKLKNNKYINIRHIFS